MHPAGLVLEELARELRALLSQLGAEARGNWPAAWGRCQALFERYRAAAPDPSALPAAEARALSTALEEVVRLHAVAAGLAARERDTLAGSVRGIASARRRARDSAAGAGSAGLGASCDLSG